MVEMKWYRIKLKPFEMAEDEFAPIEGYIVTSPDIQGLVTEGNSLAEAVLNAYEAAGLLLNDDDYNFRLKIMK